jgi:hypothetical protein
MPKAITIEPIDGKPGKPGQVYYPSVSPSFNPTKYKQKT